MGVGYGCGAKLAGATNIIDHVQNNAGPTGMVKV